jgi:hypothetical protein
MSQPQLCRGSIVRAKEIVGVLWSTSEDGAHVIPAVVRGAGLHRSDVSCDGEPLLPNGALRANWLRTVKARLTVTGRVSDETVAKLDQALRREVRAVQFESRHTPREHTERVVRF